MRYKVKRILVVSGERRKLKDRRTYSKDSYVCEYERLAPNSLDVAVNCNHGNDKTIALTINPTRRSLLDIRIQVFRHKNKHTHTLVFSSKIHPVGCILYLSILSGVLDRSTSPSASANCFSVFVKLVRIQGGPKYNKGMIFIQSSIGFPLEFRNED